MFFGPDPLNERITLMWHNHFATSNLKVDNLAAMLEQNEAFRRLGRSKFGELLPAVVKGRAMLVWLDAPANRKGHPNENLGRELMELFTLGIGNYSERDVKEAARALTGWSLEEESGFVERKSHHDAGEKAVLGKTGRWGGDDLVKLLLESPATSHRLAFRLIEQWMGEGGVNQQGRSELAFGLRQRGLDIGWGVETILRSRAFFEADNLHRRIQSPVEFVLNSLRALEAFDPPPSTLVLAEWLTRLGQDLFYPPNVGGWTGGRAWLNPRTLIGRVQFACALVQGSGVGRPGPCKVQELLHRHGVKPTLPESLDFLVRLLLGRDPEPGVTSRLTAALDRESRGLDGKLDRLTARILSTPEAQLN
jgi:uncharacterized protein (DUF1800 family)